MENVEKVTTNVDLQSGGDEAQLVVFQSVSYTHLTLPTNREV